MVGKYTNAEEREMEITRLHRELNRELSDLNAEVVVRGGINFPEYSTKVDMLTHKQAVIHSLKEAHALSDVVSFKALIRRTLIA